MIWMRLGLRFTVMAVTCFQVPDSTLTSLDPTVTTFTEGYQKLSSASFRGSPSNC